MLKFIAKRILMAIVTIIIISILTFIIIQLPPGDYVSTYVATMSASGNAVSEEAAIALREQWGLGEPLFVQYFKWAGLMLQGNFGMSLEWGKPVLDVVGDRMMLTIVVAVAAIIFTCMVALPIGIYSAVKRYSVFDYIMTILGFLGLAIPGFLLGLIVLYLGYKWFGASIGGLFSPEFVGAEWSIHKFWDLIKHLPTAAIVIGVEGTAQMIRIMRSNLLDELKQPYVKTARARGLKESKVILKYPVRVALNPFISTVGYLLPNVINGSVIVSMVLSLPTVGPLLLKALVAQDMFLSGTIILMLAVMVVIGTLISDLLLLWVDPRIKIGDSQ